MALDPYTELRKQPLRKYVTPTDFDQLKQFLTFDKQVSDPGTPEGLFPNAVLLISNLFWYMCILKHSIYNFFFFCLLSFVFSRAAPMACGGSQARGLIRAIAAGLRHSHSNMGSEQCLWPTPQFTAMPDP